MNLKYTLIFIFYKSKVLLLNRKYNPGMGLFSGLGGHIEHNESPIDCAYRELEEESGIRKNEVTLYHVDDSFTLNSHIFCGVLSNKRMLSKLPLDFEEGLLVFRDINWCIDKNNKGIEKEIRECIIESLKVAMKRW